MSNSQRVYHTVLRSILPNCPTQRITQARNLAWFITGLFVAAHCQLTRIAAHLPWDGDRDSIVQRLRRVLMNPRLNVRALYAPTVRYLLHWLKNQEQIILVIDRTTLGNALNILMVGIAFRGRVLPLAWKVQKKQGTFQLRYVHAALRFIAEQLPPDTHHIWVVGDREYQDVVFQAFVRDTLHWHFVQRLDQSIWAFPTRYKAFKLNASGLQRGELRSWGRCRITQQQFGLVELIGYWAPDEDEPWYLISDVTLGREAVQIYARRFWIEEMFRDFKSHGWDLETSGLEIPARFERLLFVMALAYVWLVQVAVTVVKRGWRHWVDRKARRTLSYFRLGWNWLNRMLARNQRLPCPVLGLGFPK
jgi:hypothetical protein